MCEDENCENKKLLEQEREKYTQLHRFAQAMVDRFAGLKNDVEWLVGAYNIMEKK